MNRSIENNPGLRTLSIGEMLEQVQDYLIYITQYEFGIPFPPIEIQNINMSLI